MSGSVKTKALYTIVELAEMAGIRERRLRKWIRREGMPLVRYGRSVMVSLPVFRAAFPQVWAAVRLQNAMRAGRCEACGATVQP